MKQILNLLLLSSLSLLCYSSCTVEVSDDDMDTTDEISDQQALGSTGENMPFELETALVENTNLFDQDGYYFHLFDTLAVCGSNFLNGDIRFFVPSDSELEPGSYTGDGPFITNTSYFGCDVVITTVTDSLIEGKVKGGDFNTDKFVEGSFSAQVCQ